MVSTCDACLGALSLLLLIPPHHCLESMFVLATNSSAHYSSGCLYFDFNIIDGGTSLARLMMIKAMRSSLIFLAEFFFKMTYNKI